MQLPQDLTNLESWRVTKPWNPTHWWDGTPLTEQPGGNMKQPPPMYTGWHWPPNSCPYYRTAYKKNAKTFTDGHGHIYRPLYDKLKDSFLSAKETDNLPPSHPFYRMIPSFFSTLVKLQELDKDYTLVLRTFGSDLDDIAQALKDFAVGKHPLFPTFREPKLLLEECNMFRGRYSQGHNTDAVYDLFDWKSHRKVASGDEELLHVIEKLSVCGIRDDYEYWYKNDHAPMCGKPVWIHPKGTGSFHHLFFDDNIHNDANDSIVAVRSRDKDGEHWNALSGEETIAEQGKYVVRVPTVAAVLQDDWFLQQIALAEDRVNASS